MDIVEIMKVIGSIVDYPVTVAGFVWALRMIERMHAEVTELLRDCLGNQKEP